MALIEAEIATWLMANSSITTLVGTRIYGNKTPVGVTYPCLTYFKVSREEVRDMSGASGLVTARIQINSWALNEANNANYAKAKTIADQLRKELDNYRGTIGTTAIDAIFLEEEADVTDKHLAIDDSVPMGIRQDFQVRYREVVDDNT